MMSRLLALLVAALALSWVAIVNGGPIAFPDSGAYLTDAEMLARLHAPNAVRPVTYGLFAWVFSFGERWFFPVILAQGFVVAWVLDVTVRALRLPVACFVGVVAASVVLTPLPWHVAHLLPDVFVPAMVLALFLLGLCREHLAGWERVALAVLVAAAAAMHLTALPIGAAIAVTCLVWRSMARRGGILAALGWMGAPLGIAVAGLLGFSLAIWQRPLLAPNSPPFLLARMLADGPARDYLAATCPGSGYELCSYLDRLPGTEYQFLWRLLPVVPTADGKRIKAEADAVMLGTASMFPGRVAAAMALNTARQLVTFGADMELTAAQWEAARRDPAPLARVFSGTLEGRGLLWGWLLPRLNVVYEAVAVLSLVVAGVALRRLRLALPGALVVTVVVALVVNAFVCGALSGVFARYEGRIEWLLPMAAIVAGEACGLWRRAPSRKAVMPAGTRDPA